MEFLYLLTGFFIFKKQLNPFFPLKENIERGDIFKKSG